MPLNSKSSFQHAREECESKGAYVFRCLMFNLSGHCELFLLCFIASLTRAVVSVMLYPCILCVALLMYLFVLCVACLTVFCETIHNICGCYFVVKSY